MRMDNLFAEQANHYSRERATMEVEGCFSRMHFKYQYVAYIWR